MAKAVITLEGQDNASTAIRSAGKSVKSLEDKLEDAKKKFKSITESSGSLKRKLAQLKAEMANMNFDGLNKTKLFYEMAEQAGAYADAIGDASQATNAFANDVFAIEAATQALGALAGAGSVVTGAMALFGQENENVQKAILKVQSALAILNGIQAVSNALNKDSALRLKIQQVWRLAKAAATRTETASLNGATTATVANTVATSANTLAMKAWNVVKAIGKALMGDWTGLLIVGAGALLTYSLATGNSTEKEKEQQSELSKTAKALQEKTNTINNAVGETISKYELLRQSYLRCTNDHQRTEWAEVNKSALESLGIKWDNLRSLEDAFVNNTGKVVEALKARAKASALEELYKDNFKKRYSNKSVASGDYHTVYKKGSTVTKEDAEKYKELYGSNAKVPKVLKFDYQIEVFNRIAKQTASDRKKVVEEETKQLEEDMNNAFKDADKKIADAGLVNNVPKKTSKTKTKTTKPKKKKEEEEKPETGSVKYYEELISAEKKYRETHSLTSEEIEKSNTLLQSYNKSLQEAKSKLEQPQDKTYYENLNDEIKKLKDELYSLDPNDINFEDKFATITVKLDVKTKELKEFEKKINREAEKVVAPKSKLELYDEIASKISKVQELYDKGLIDEDKARNQIENLNTEIDKLGGKKIYLEVDSNFDKTISSMQKSLSSFNSIDGIRSSIESLTSDLDENKDAWSLMMDVVGVASNTLSAIQGVVEGYNAIMEISTLLTQKNTFAKTANTLADSSGIAPKIASAGATTTEAVAAQEDTTAQTTDAVAKTMNAHSGIPFVGVAIGAALVATLLATILSVKGKFANGGIIGGSTTVGDLNLAKVNAGEMILNTRQQGRLFRLLDGNGNYSNTSPGGGSVTFKIQGKELVGVLNNYNKKTNKVM